MQKEPLSKEAKERIATVVVGNGLEFFDYMVYIHLLVVLTPIFFPQEDPLIGKLMAYSTLLISYLITPFGGVILGYVGDNWGRVPSLSLSLVLMAIASIIFCALPTYASIGIWAAAGLLFARIIQCFAASGEDVGASIFLVEESPPDRVCSISSLVEVSGYIGALIGLVLGYVCLSFRPSDGWRFPFMAGGMLAIVGLWMRYHLTETESYKKMKKRPQAARIFFVDIFKKHSKNILCVIGLSAPMLSSFHLTYFYLPDVLNEDFGVPMTNILGYNTLLMVLDIVVILIMSRVADAVGYQKMLKIACYTTIIIAYPLFFLMSNLKSFASIVIVQLALILISDTISSAVRPLIVSLFPVVGRYTAYAFSWNMGCLIFRGLGSFACLFLKKWLGITGPAIYLILAAFVFWVSLRMAKPFDEEKEAQDDASSSVDFQITQKAA